VVTDMVFKVLATPLDNERRLSLRDIALDHRLNELEFYYPIARLESHKLRALLVAHHFAGETVLNEQVEDLDFQPASGYLKGFIGESRLPAVMARESYYLQYLLYTVAVHRHLRQKMTGYDYDQHFGGVFYLFLRGMDPALGPAFGIFRDRPSKKLVQALDDYMATGSLGIPT
jgi:exodeoxyribonuclease V beta subunit